jgi:hypothetical protein
MITVEYADFLLTVLTVCAVLITAVIVPVVLRMRQALARLEAPVDRLTTLIPEIERLAIEGEQAIRSMRTLADAAGAIAQDVGSVTASTREVAMPLIEQLSSSVETTQTMVRRLTALAVGAQAGIAALRRTGTDDIAH